MIDKVLRELAAIGIAIILVEHDMELVMGVSSHVIVLDAGAKIAEGPPREVAAAPAVREAYLGAGEQADRGRERALPARDAPLLTVRSLSAGYGAATVVRDAALEVADGELVAVLGANGAGKTTLMRALSGLIRPVAGEVRFLGRRIDQLAGDRIAREGLILVPEGRQVFPELSVIDNLRLGAYARRSDDAAGRIEALLERFAALKARRHQRAGLLSGGEQQMLAIARGLMARPEVLMLDEPSLGLAPKLLEVLYDLLGGIARGGNDDPARRPDGDARAVGRRSGLCAAIRYDQAFGQRARSRRGPGADARLSRRSRDRTVTEAQPREERPPWTSFSGTRGASAPSTN